MTPKIVVENESQKRSPRRRRPRRSNKGQNAFVSLAQPQYSRKNTESIVISGVDRFAHIQDVAAYEGQSLIMEIPITAAVFPRLESLANNYQNWQVEKLEFRVNPQISTQTNGGYICGYSRDPLEKIGTGTDALNAITSLRGSQTKKWWEDSIIKSYGSPKVLFTQESGDERFFADGIFYLASDGKATTAGALTIYVDYTVKLMKPVLRSTEEPELEKIEDTPLQHTLWYVYQEGDAKIGYLMYLDPATGKVDNLDGAIPGIDEFFAKHINENLYFTTSRFIPGLKTDEVAEYNMAPKQMVYQKSAIDGKSGFVVLVTGVVPNTSYIGDDYSNKAGNIDFFHVPGPQKGETLRGYGIITDDANENREGRKGLKHLCIMKTNK